MGIGEKDIKRLVAEQHGKGITFEATADPAGVKVGIEKDVFPSGSDERNGIKKLFENAGFAREREGKYLILPSPTAEDAVKAAERLNNPSISMTAVVLLQKDKMKLRSDLQALADSLTPTQSAEAGKIKVSREDEERKNLGRANQIDVEKLRGILKKLGIVFTDNADPQLLEIRENIGGTKKFKGKAFADILKKSDIGVFTERVDPRLLAISKSYENPDIAEMAVNFGIEAKSVEALRVLQSEDVGLEKGGQTKLYASAMGGLQVVQDRERQLLKAEIGNSLRAGENVESNSEMRKPGGEREAKQFADHRYLKALKDKESRGR